MKIVEMNDEQLLEAYTKGKEYFKQKFQVTDSELAEDGTKYDHELFLRINKRLSAIEREVIKRRLL